MKNSKRNYSAKHWFSAIMIVTIFAGCSDDSGTNSISCNTGFELCGNACCANTCCDGICVDISKDAHHCGQCGHACDPGKSCVLNNCLSSEEQCSPLQTWCDGECVNTSSDNRHCGDCTTECDEKEVCIDKQCTTECAPGYRLIDGACRNTLVDNEYCGDPASPCTENTYCSEGTCKCQKGYYDCDEDPANGCESHAACDAAECKAPRMLCDEQCIDPQTDAEHCGNCETSCSPDESCQSGSCQPVSVPTTECETGEEVCFGVCVDLKVDPNHCGKCLNACNEDETCNNGTCTLNCGTLKLCGNACIDTQNSAAHCGDCNRACLDGQACVGGTCQCAKDHYDCDGNTANGCESETKCECTPGDTQPCWRGEASAIFKSTENPKTICEKGSRTCDVSGQFWGACTGGVYPAAVTCDLMGNLNGLDNDCDGKIDTECRSECDLKAGEMSYIGCEYWGAYIDNLITNQYSNHTFVISNPNDTAANVYIYDKAHAADSTASPVKTQTIEPHDVIAIEMHNTGYNMCKGSGILPNAYRIRSDMPITAYQFSPLGNPDAHSNDASLLLPANVLGDKYIGMTWHSESAPDHRSYIAIIAIDPGKTDVTFKTTSKIQATETAEIQVSSSEKQAQTPIVAMEKGDTQHFTLNQYEVLTLMAPGGNEHNQTGSLITTDEGKRIAVFGGSRATYVPANAGCCRDHIEEQLFPTQAWGKSYLAARAYSGGVAGDFWVITARDDNTTIHLTKGLKNLNNNNADIPETITLNAGETYPAFETRTPFEIKADKPISVGQFLPSQAYNKYYNPDNPSQQIGDPSFILTVPYEQYRSDYDFMVPTKFNTNYLTIIAPKDAAIQYDGNPITYISTREQIGTSDFYVGYIQVQPGVHHMTADVPFGLYSYGYYNMSSYGYPIGLDLKVLNTN